MLGSEHRLQGWAWHYSLPCLGARLLMNASLFRKVTLGVLPLAERLPCSPLGL